MLVWVCFISVSEINPSDIVFTFVICFWAAFIQFSTCRISEIPSLQHRHHWPLSQWVYLRGLQTTGAHRCPRSRHAHIWFNVGSIMQNHLNMPKTKLWGTLLVATSITSLMNISTYPSCTYCSWVARTFLNNSPHIITVNLLDEQLSRYLKMLQRLRDGCLSLVITLFQFLNSEWHSQLCYSVTSILTVTMDLYPYFAIGETADASIFIFLLCTCGLLKLERETLFPWTDKK